MAKEQWHNWGRYILLAVVIIFASGGWVMKVMSNTDAIAELEIEGCKPIIPLTIGVELVKKDISVMQKDISDMRTEQQKGFEAILRRLPE